jgi:thymidine phosphorylase
MPDEATAKIRAALGSGQGLERWRKIVEQQGGDPRSVDEPGRLPQAPRQMIVRAEHSGFVADIHAELVGRACVLLGAGRQRAEDAVDPAVGVVVLAHRGEAVRAGDGLAEVHYRADVHLAGALDLLKVAWRIADAAPTPQAIVLETLAATTDESKST